MCLVLMRPSLCMPFVKELMLARAFGSVLAMSGNRSLLGSKRWMPHADHVCAGFYLPSYWHCLPASRGKSEEAVSVCAQPGGDVTGDHFSDVAIKYAP